MSDPKRATLITVGASKSEKNKVNKTVRLTINLDESNESKYPELNYKELVITEERNSKQKVENGKTDGLNPFSDNDDDVERVARKFEQKYGGNSTYGRKKRSKHDEFADIGAGYDENDSFIDNTDGYDEMIPPECDTLYGGFYINSGSLEFKNVDHPPSDDEGPRGPRNKRRISSSSSEEESSDSSSSSETPEGKGPQALLNGNAHSEHRKQNTKKSEKKKPKKIRRTDSSAATSGKQTSDDNVAESADSRTSQSDSLTSKPATSENPATSDSSRDVEAKQEVKLPSQVVSVLEELEAIIARTRVDKPNMSHKEIETLSDPHVFRLERALSKCSAENRIRRVVWTRAAHALRMSRSKLLMRAKSLACNADTQGEARPQPASQPPSNNINNSTSATSNKRRVSEVFNDFDPSTLNSEEKEAKIAETLDRLKALIEEKKPSMIANYNAECERVQEERKKIQIAAAAEGGPPGECTKRLPKRRFPWCPKSRTLLGRLVKLAKDQESAGVLLVKRALPLFPSGFVRVPTLLRQADLNKDLKLPGVKRQRLNSNSQTYTQPQPTSVIQPTSSVPTTSMPGPTPAFQEPIHFPSSLTVTTMKSAPDKTETASVTEDKEKSGTLFGQIYNIFSLNKDLLIETQNDKQKEDIKTDDYIPNNKASITITAVPANTQKKSNNGPSSDKPKQTEGLIRIKSPAALNEMVQKQEKEKAIENSLKKDSHVIHKQEKAKPVESTHKRDTIEISHKHDKAKPVGQTNKLIEIEIPHKQEKAKSVEQTNKRDTIEISHKHEKAKFIEQSNKRDTIEITHSTHKAKHVEQTNKQDTTEKSHKHEKAKALENIHKRDIIEVSHRNNKTKTPDIIEIEINTHKRDTNDTSHKQEKVKALENIHKRDKDKLHKDKHRHHSSSKDKRLDTPLHIDTTFPTKHKEPTPSPKSRDEVTHKTVDNLRIDERNIPRPTLIPVHHSPTFAKPDKRPPDVKKKKDVLIVSDLDPLGEQNEPVAVDDSSSDVEVVEEKSVNSEKVTVPLNNKSLKDMRKDSSKDGVKSDRAEKLDQATKEDFDSVMKNLKDLEQHSQEAAKLNTSSYGGVITSEQTSLNKMDGCSALTG